jgi:hypothetical protein
MHFIGGTKSGATGHGATMELLQFSRDSKARRHATETRPEVLIGMSFATQEFLNKRK